MRVLFLGSKAATGVPTDVTAVTPFDKYVDERVGVVQAEFGGSTSTLTVEGRVTDAANWTTITTITSSDTSKAKTVALMTNMRINVTSYSGSGTVSAYLGI